MTVLDIKAVLQRGSQCEQQAANNPDYWGGYENIDRLAAVLRGIPFRRLYDEKLETLALTIKGRLAAAAAELGTIGVALDTVFLEAMFGALAKDGTGKNLYDVVTTEWLSTPPTGKPLKAYFELLHDHGGFPMMHHATLVQYDANKRGIALADFLNALGVYDYESLYTKSGTESQLEVARMAVKNARDVGIYGSHINGLCCRCSRVKDKLICSCNGGAPNDWCSTATSGGCSLGSVTCSP